MRNLFSVLALVLLSAIATPSKAQYWSILPTDPCVTEHPFIFVPGSGCNGAPIWQDIQCPSGSDIIPCKEPRPPAVEGNPEDPEDLATACYELYLNQIEKANDDYEACMDYNWQSCRKDVSIPYTDCWGGTSWYTCTICVDKDCPCKAAIIDARASAWTAYMACIGDLIGRIQDAQPTYTEIIIARLNKDFDTHIPVPSWAKS